MGLVVDLFAGGGGASEGIRMALGRDPDIAVNHDQAAVAMHKANHPSTRHYVCDIHEVDPVEACRGESVDLLWASPDCTHHSKAKGGKPRDRKMRFLAWAVVDWARKVRPSVICLENVEEFRNWGPLDPEGQPIKAMRGKIFDAFAATLRNLGYSVDWRELRACDFGAPTSRKRLFLVARCDGNPIVWPKATHGSGEIPYRTAAECIDWSIPCPSIFERKKPLADATCRRIAKGVVRFVLQNPRPFIVKPNHTARTGYYQCFRGQGVDEPLQTVTQAPGFALVSAFLAKHYGGVVGSDLGDPLATVTAVDHHSLVSAALVRQFGASSGASVEEPLGTAMPGGGGKTSLVAAFLSKYYGQSIGEEVDGQMGTVTSKDRFGLVTVIVCGEPFVIADIGLRMLQSRELFRAQGFPDEYVIDPVLESGKRLTATAQVRMCGNSVCPPIAAALIRANVREVREEVA